MIFGDFCVLTLLAFARCWCLVRELCLWLFWLYLAVIGCLIAVIWGDFVWVECVAWVVVVFGWAWVWWRVFVPSGFWVGYLWVWCDSAVLAVGCCLLRWVWVGYVAGVVGFGGFLVCFGSCCVVDCCFWI